MEREKGREERSAFKVSIFGFFKDEVSFFVYASSLTCSKLKKKWVGGVRVIHIHVEVLTFLLFGYN